MSDVAVVPHVEVLRLGHRPLRDKRVTTHVALVARAFLASAIHIDNADPVLEGTIEKMSGSFGGGFEVHTGVKARKLLERWDGTIVHLTMYGRPLQDAITEIPKDEKLLVVVGSEKVPAEIYDLAHFNVGVTNQPHSEVSALALFLDRLFEGRELCARDMGGMMEVVPTARGKQVRNTGDVRSVPTNGPFSRKWPPVPDPRDCIELLAEVGCSRAVIEHCRAVHRMGMVMVKASMKADRFEPLGLDLPLIEAGLLLHDIGRSRTHSIRHVVQGTVIARRLSLDPRLVDMVHNHIGAGVPRHEAVALGLPDEDFLPRTLEEKLVCHSDNLVGSKGRHPLKRSVEKLVEKGALAAAERMVALHLELEERLGIDIDLLVPEGTERRTILP
jgi:tRNA (cytidine56-2'-O)-methyltransferase